MHSLFRHKKTFLIKWHKGLNLAGYMWTTEALEHPTCPAVKRYRSPMQPFQGGCPACLMIFHMAINIYASQIWNKPVYPDANITFFLIILNLKWIKRITKRKVTFLTQINSDAGCSSYTWIWSALCIRRLQHLKIYDCLHISENKLFQSPSFLIFCKIWKKISTRKLESMEKGSLHALLLTLKILK